MEILVITWNYPPRRGGVENLLGNLCAELEKKHSVHVITASVPSAVPGEKNVFRSPLPGLLPFALYALWRGALLLLRNPHVRVVLGGSALVAPLVVLIAHLFRRRAMVLTHGLDVAFHRDLYQLLCVSWLKSCDCVIANSAYTAALVKAKRVTADRLTVIPPGVEPERFSVPNDEVTTRRRWNIENKKIIFFVGRLARRKGVKEFIENSLLDIVNEVPQALFLVAGANPTESLTHRDDVVGELSEVISRHRLDDHVRLLGSISDDELLALYQVCDVVVLPVLDKKDDVEGFGIVALEAAAAGKAVVATRVGGIADAVEDGKNGVLIEPGNYRLMSQTISALLKDREACLSLGRYGRCRVIKQFSWCCIGARYEDVFESATCHAS